MMFFCKCWGWARLFPVGLNHQRRHVPVPGPYMRPRSSWRIWPLRVADPGQFPVHCVGGGLPWGSVIHTNQTETGLCSRNGSSPGSRTKRTTCAIAKSSRSALYNQFGDGTGRSLDAKLDKKKKVLEPTVCPLHAALCACCWQPHPGTLLRNTRDSRGTWTTRFGGILLLTSHTLFSSSYTSGCRYLGRKKSTDTPAKPFGFVDPAPELSSVGGVCRSRTRRRPDPGQGEVFFPSSGIILKPWYNDWMSRVWWGGT